MHDKEERRKKARERREERKRRDPKELARAHPTRVTILAMLSKDGDGLTAEDVRDGLPDDRPLAAVVYHLAVLREADLLHVDGEGDATRFTLAA